jgi:hypothetical protein
MKENLLTLLETSRGYTLAVTEVMPQKLDSFKPANVVWSFREQLHHIAYGIEWWKDNYVRGVKHPGLHLQPQKQEGGVAT